MTQPTQQEVKELFNYSDDGFLVWSVNRKRARVGNKVGAHDPSGYLRTRVHEKLHLVHRLIFLWHHGYMPEMVDHIDGNKSNNRIENLREANRVTNQHNTKLSCMNTSGSKNVSFCAQTKKWAVKMMLFDKRRTLGRFDDIELADLVAQEARAKFHGAFARNY